MRGQGEQQALRLGRRERPEVDCAHAREHEVVAARHKQRRAGRWEERGHLTGIGGVVGQDERPLAGQRRAVERQELPLIVGELRLRLEGANDLL